MTTRVKLGGMMLAGAAVAGSAFAYSPYPGQLPVTVVEVKAANRFVISFETWPGFGRRMEVDLPGIAVPSTDPEAPECERQLGEKALAFSRQFVAGKTISVKDMEMKNSAATVGYSDLFAGDASLIEALTAEGLARRAAASSTTPWCDDETQ